MRYASALAPALLLAACQAPDIDDWPPTPPPVPDETVQRYVDIYARDADEAPRYGPDDIKALTILLDRQARTRDDEDDIGRLRRELDNIREKSDEDGESAPDARSRNEINAIKRRVERKYESRHDQRHELRSRYGL